MMSDSNTICNSINVNALIKNSFISSDQSEHDSMLKTIHIRSFRCFDDLTLDLSGPRGSAQGYAAVYGRNGSGKSTLVGAVEFLCRTMRSFPADGGAIASVESLTASVREEAMVGSGTGPSVGIGFVLDGDTGEYEVSFDDDGMLQSEILRFRVGTRKGTVFSISRKDGGYDVFVNRRSVTDRRLREELSSDAGRYLGAHTMLSIILYRRRTSNREYMDTFSDPGIGRALDFLCSINTGPGGDAMDWLYTNPLSGTAHRRDLPALEAYGHALERFLRRIDPDTVSVRYVTGDGDAAVPYELRVVREISGSEREIPVNREPAGTLSLIHALPRLLSSACGGISVVDGLGAEVHESLLSDILGEMLPDLRGQLVFTTHSTALLNVVDPRHVLVLDVDLDGDRKAHRLKDVTVLRTGHNIRDRYVRGEMGGIPVTGRVDIDQIALTLQGELECPAYKLDKYQ